LSFAIAIVIRAQAPQRLTFDVVSVKPNHSGVVWSSRSPIKDKVGHYTARNATLKSLVSWFFGVNDAQIVGGPGWVGVDRYDIQAQVDGQPTRDELFEMLQALLADRFQLQVHRESREMSRYVLVTPKNGLKFGPHFVKAGDRDCSNGSASTPGCRGIVFSPKTVTIEYTDFGQVAQTLSSIIGRVVVDQTGLEGKYDISLDLEVTPPNGAPALSLGDTIMAALREQIGVRFDSQKGPVPVLVIDRAERPVEN
jgi:uncharacterized protein (TIGR03435 family)